MTFERLDEHSLYQAGRLYADSEELFARPELVHSVTDSVQSGVKIDMVEGIFLWGRLTVLRAETAKTTEFAIIIQGEVSTRGCVTDGVTVRTMASTTEEYNGTEIGVLRGIINTADFKSERTHDFNDIGARWQLGGD